MKETSLPWFDLAHHKWKLRSLLLRLYSAQVLSEVQWDADKAPNVIDRNVIWGSTKTNGIYYFFDSHVIVARNMIGNCAGGGLALFREIQCG